MNTYFNFQSLMCTLGQQCPRDELRKKRVILNPYFIDTYTIDRTQTAIYVDGVIDRELLRDHIIGRQLHRRGRLYNDQLLHTIIIGTPAAIRDTINANRCNFVGNSRSCDYTVSLPEVIELEFEPNLDNLNEPPALRFLSHGPRSVQFRMFRTGVSGTEPAIGYVLSSRDVSRPDTDGQSSNHWEPNPEDVRPPGSSTDQAEPHDEEPGRFGFDTGMITMIDQVIILTGSSIALEDHRVVRK